MLQEVSKLGLPEALGFKGNGCMKGVIMDDIILQAVIVGLVVGIFGAIVYYRGRGKNGRN